jgi:hypothetical protein
LLKQEEGSRDEKKRTHNVMWSTLRKWILACRR